MNNDTSTTVGTAVPANQVIARIAQHLAHQKQLAVGPSGMCTYRSLDGAACAVGCLISDTAACSVEGFTALQIFEEPSGARTELISLARAEGYQPQKFFDLLSEFQAYHDNEIDDSYSLRLSQTQDEDELLALITQDLNLILIWSNSQ